MVGEASSYRSTDELIADPDVEAILVATPHSYPQPIAVEALRAGKHVMAEKPTAVNAAEAAEIERAVAGTSLTYMAGYSFRYFSLVAQAKRLVDDGVIGTIQTFSAGFTRPKVPTGWAGDAEFGGGTMLFYGCHLVDRVLWFLDDDPIEVVGTVERDAERGVDRTSVFQVRFRGGAVAQFNVCGSSDGWFDYLHVCGSDGHLYLSLAAVPNYQLTVSSIVDDRFANAPTRQRANAPTRQRANALTTTTDLDKATAFQMKLTAELQDFAAAIRSGEQPPITARDGLRVLQVHDAAADSSLTGKPVTLAGGSALPAA